MHCLGGTLSCIQDKLPVAETCNGLDDDCDGEVEANLERLAQFEEQ